MAANITEETKGFKNTFFLTVLFVFYCVVALISSEFSMFFNGKELTGDYLFLSLGSSFLSIALGILFWLLFTKKKGYRNNRFLLILTSLLFLGDVVALLAFPSSIQITEKFNYVSSFSFRLNLIVSFFGLCLLIYNFYSFFFLLKTGKKSFAFIFEALAVIAIICVIISYFTDFEDYMVFFRGDRAYIESILGHKNTFGMVVVFGLMAETYLFNLNKKWWRLFPILYLSISLFPINSKSSLLCAMILVFGYILYYGILHFNKNRKLSIACFVVFAIALFSYGFMLVFPSSKEGVFSDFIRACRSVFFGGDGTTIGSRYYIYEETIAQLNLSPLFWMFGYGNSNFQYSFYYACDDWSIDRVAPTFHAHNGFIQCLACGGIWRLCLYAAFLGYLIYRFIKKFQRTHDANIFMSLLFFLVFFARTLVEPEYLFGDTLRGMAYALFIAEPILSIESEKELPFQWNYIPALLKRYGSLLIGSLSAGILVFASVYKERISLTLFLPLGIILYGLFAYFSRKEKGDMLVFILSSIFLIASLLSLSFGLGKEASSTTIAFSFVFGFSLPLLSFLIADCLSPFSLYREEMSLV